MKQLSHLKKTKWIAALFAVLFGTAALIGLLAALYTYEMELYQKPLQTVIKEHQADLQKYYSIRIIDCREKNKQLPDITNMEYGIIKSDTGLLQDVNIVDTNNYIYTIFHETKPLDTSYTMKYITGSSKKYKLGNPTLISSLSGKSLGSMPDSNDKIEHRDVIERIVYNTTDKQFYFEAGSHSFPIYHISVAATHVKAARNISKGRLKDHENFTFGSITEKYESDSGNCEPLDTENYRKWDHLHCEGGRFYTKNVNTITWEDMLPKEVTPNVTLVKSPNEDPDGHPPSYESVNNSNTSYPYLYYETPVVENCYWVVSNVKKEIDTSSPDLFAKQAVFLSDLYEYRYLFIGCVLFFSTGFILALSYLCYITKLSQAVGMLPTRIWDKIPLLLYLVIMVSLITASAWILGNYILRPLLYGHIGTYAASAFGLPLILLGVFLAVLLWMNLIERYFGKTLWKYSVTSHLISFSKRIYHMFQQNTRLMVKGGIAFFAICLIELSCMFLTLLITDGNSDMLLLDWVLFKIIALPVFYLVLLQMKYLQTESRRLAEGNLRSKLDTGKMLWEFRKHGDYLNQIGDGMSIALEERLKSERFKTELITNVSHDIKTPLTSIINYIDLLQKEEITPEERGDYIAILERQSARLKKLIEDLLEASKASAGTLPVYLEECDIDILLTQTAGEYEEKLSNSQLELIVQKKDTPVHIQADNRHLWRIFDNLMNNICKYSQPGTRVYINQKTEPERVRIFFLNTSKYPLNISGDELMERFVRGDASRNTEGNGLGLSIARSLTELMNGTLKISIEGDLFKVILAFPTDTE